MQANRMTQLTLHEMLTVRFMPLPKFQGSHKGLPLDQLKIELTKICLNYIDMDMLLAEQGGCIKSSHFYLYSTFKNNRS